MIKKNIILNSFKCLKEYCEFEKYIGWDPYDGLNSKIFQAIPFLKNSTLCRLIAIQGFKRCPINLRKIALIPKQYNAKGLGLFLQGYCNLYAIILKEPSLESSLGTKLELLSKIKSIADLLISMKSEGYSGACWGYGFDWQSRAFFLPANTPTVVATSFVVEALLSAYETTNNKKYLNVAQSSVDFILKDLNRICKGDEYMFSYSPLDSRAVYNASLLGSKTLALIYHYTKDENLKSEAYKTVKAVCACQNDNGSFPHSDQVGNKWRDSFHTGFKLESLAIYQKYCNDESFSSNIELGYDYWIKHYFNRETGLAYYYDTPSNLIDLHCVGQAIPTLFKLNKLDSELNLAESLLSWSIENMYDESLGYFYFQKKGNLINKIPYMRWPNAWMFYSMSYFFLKR